MQSQMLQAADAFDLLEWQTCQYRPVFMIQERILLDLLSIANCQHVTTGFAETKQNVIFLWVGMQAQ